MILKIFRPKNWKKLFIGVIATGITSIAVVCFTLRMIPALSAQSEITAMAAAGFILPGGAAQALKGDMDTEHMVPNNLEDVSSVVSQIISSQAGSGSSLSSAIPPASSLVSSQSPKKKWTGKPYPIQETQVTQGNTTWNNVVVKNSTQNHKVDIEKVLQERPDVTIKKDGTPQVLIYHTHSSESYMSEESDTYYSDMPTRSQKEEENVMSVGEVLAEKLRAAGIGVIHDKTYHDYPAYNGSYTRSAETIQKNLEKYPTIQVTIDVHRDAISGANGERKKPTAVVNGKKAAQVMILSGCDDDGTLGYPDWEYNLRLAMRVQQACEKYENNFIRPLTFSATKYNQNLTHGSMLVEFGTEVNTLEEAKYSASLFGDALVSVLNDLVE